jgi:hypothetical protein
MVVSDIFIMKSTAASSLLGKDRDHIPPIMVSRGAFLSFTQSRRASILSQTCRRFAVRRNAHDKVFIGQHEARLVVVAGSRRLGRERDAFAHARAF